MIVYDSETGNTEKMASAVAEGIKNVEGAEVIVKKVDQVNVDDLLEVDGIIIGSPTYFGQMSAKVKNFIDKSIKVYGKLEGKVGAAFTSSGGTATGAETTLLSIIEAMLVHGMVVQGRSEDKHYGAAAVGEPDEEALENCRELGKRTALLAKKLKG
ncbi:NAD(P)H-dependent oxidoreductase [Candidatus Bathyarchaeota archaeon]|nr:NAD(P)H-dependent oxidoreductase [Candidatus Bathyarchaeota archaeon]